MRLSFTIQSKGFSLVELIVVIVILGIITVVALPRFIDLSSDARITSIQALSSAVKSSSELVYAQAYLQGVHHLASSSVNINGTDVNIVYGYPQSALINSIFSQDYDAWLNISASLNNNSNADWVLTDDLDSDGVTLGTSNNGQGIGFLLSKYQADTGLTDGISLCGVSYKQAIAAGEKPQINAFVSEC